MPELIKAPLEFLNRSEVEVEQFGSHDRAALFEVDRNFGCRAVGLMPWPGWRVCIELSVWE
jgi:hypothetical protein